MKKGFKNLMIIFFALFVLATPVFAKKTIGDAGSMLDVAVRPTGLETVISLPQRIGGMIQIGLSLVGLIFFVLMFYAGFSWLTAQGNEETVKKSRNTIIAAIIGLMVVAAAYGITYFVTDRLINLNATSPTDALMQGEGPAGCCFDRVKACTDEWLITDFKFSHWAWRMTTQGDCVGRGAAPDPAKLDCLYGEGEEYYQWHPDYDQVKCDEEWNKL